MKKCIFSLLFLVLTVSALAEEASSPRRSFRESGSFGFYLSGLGDPAPSIAGLNAAYQIIPELKLAAGVGSFVFLRATTVGVNLQYTILPWYQVSPVIGVGGSYFEGISFFNEPEPSDPNAGPFSGFVPSAKAGVEWQANFGLMLGAGATLTILDDPTVLPYVHVGWMF